MLHLPRTFQSQPLKTRIAPTPSGFLHIGNTLSFLYTWLLARKLGGQVQLRIDDLDKGRKRSEYVEDIFHTLKWLGMDWDSGPRNSADFERHHSQHLKLPQYQAALDKLRLQHNLYACDCSRKQWKSKSSNGLYPKTCRELEKPFHADNMAWRIKSQSCNISIDDLLSPQKQVSPHEEMGDFIIRKKDKLPAYQIGSVIDDITAGTNLIIRGEDLWGSSVAQLYLSQLLKDQTLPSASWIHHPLLVDSQGQKLSKSEGATAVMHLREKADGRTQLFRAFSAWVGMENNDMPSLDQLLQEFNPEAHIPH